ncbi:response regulator [Taibaiella koreensis]|uniref:response regulator n=1 Tax=Taibaiella koreensis TaxID=1268548 RepID=UPI000E59FF79|nr:response regulator transcription factor [Taibaiella koreensis]
MDYINISLVDDHPMVISGLTTLLQPFPHIVIHGTYNNAAQLLQGLQYYSPDVLLLDLMLPDQSGKELLPLIRKQYPGMRILVLTSLDTPSMVTNMLRHGCNGYLLKGAGPGTLVEAIETVYKKEEYIDPVLKEQLLQNVLHFKTRIQGNALSVKLTQREKEVLGMIAEEHTTSEIAEKLFISYHTVESHRNNLMRKLNVKNTVGLLKVAIQLGLIR